MTALRENEFIEHVTTRIEVTFLKHKEEHIIYLVALRENASGSTSYPRISSIFNFFRGVSIITEAIFIFFSASVQG